MGVLLLRPLRWIAKRSFHFDAAALHMPAHLGEPVDCRLELASAFSKLLRELQGSMRPRRTAGGDERPAAASRRICIGDLANSSGDSAFTGSRVSRAFR